MGESLNTNINMKEWIAKTEREYIDKAIKFSKDANKLSLIKEKLLQTASETSSFNASKFAKQFEKEMWKMWKKNNSNNKINI